MGAKKTRDAVAVALAGAILGIVLFGFAQGAAAGLAPPGTKGSRPGALSNGVLREAVAQLEAGKPAGHGIRLVGDRVQVEVLSNLPSQQLARLIESHGGVVQGTVEGELAQALVPFRSLESLEHAAGVRYIRRPLDISEPTAGAAGSSARSMLRARREAATATVTGQEVAKTNASAWQALGYKGAGVKVGIVDAFSSYYWIPAQTAGEVPAPAGLFCLNAGSSCDIWNGGATNDVLKHGVAVAETIHEMAPDAQLYIATVRSTTDLQAAVDYFHAQGVKIISRSQTARYDNAGDGTGPVAAVIDNAVADGMAWFNAAGNSAGPWPGLNGQAVGSYWRGIWNDPDADRWLNFSGGDETLAFNCTFINGLRWSDWGKADATDYDVYVYDDAAATQLVSTSVNTQPGSDPVEIPGCNAAGDGVDYLAIWLYDAHGGTAGDILEFMVNGAGMEYWQNQYSAAAPQVDSASTGMLAVGAIDPVNGTTIAAYSSWGPTNDGRVKPDLSAASCFSSFSYSPSCFNGTSAATPAAAGAGALVLGAGLVSTPAQLKSYLLDNATVDRGVIGTDNVYGKGELILPAPPKLSQTITFSPLAGKTYGDPDFPLAASASSGLTVSFAAAGNCTVSGVTVHLTGAGACTITASQAGNASYNPASVVAQSFSIKANQTITVTAHAPTSAGYHTSFVVAATAPGGTVSVSSSGSCSNSGSTFTMTSGSGNCTVRYDQAGNSNYVAAQVTESVAAQKANQTITFAPLSAKHEHDADFSVSASASSGLAVSFAASGSCTVSGTTVHLAGTGSCTLSASQAGDANYNAVLGVAQSFTIQAAQTPPRSCRVPNVVGKPLATAKRLIKRGHCRTGSIRYAHSRKIKSGRVISQSRRSGRVLAAGSRINLVVSRGRQR